MIFATEIEDLINRTTDEEDRNALKFLSLFNSKIGDTNNYISDFKSIKSGSLDFQSVDYKSTRTRKRFERLFLKYYEALSLSFNIVNYNSFSTYERVKILIHKYLLYSQIARAKGNRKHFIYFLRRALKISVKLERYDMTTLILNQLIQDFKYHGESKNAEKYSKRLEANRLVKGQYERLSEFSTKVNLPEFSGDVSKSDQEFIEGLQSNPIVGQVRLRRLVLYAYLIVKRQEIHKSVENINASQAALTELVDIIKANPEHFTSKELPIAENNLNILRAYEGNLKISECGFRKNYSCLRKFSPVDRLFRPNVMAVSFYSGDLPTRILQDTEEMNDLELHILASKKLVSGENCLADFARIGTERFDSEIEFFVRVYQILCFIRKADLDQADRLVFSLRKSLLLSKPFYEEFHSIILQLLWEWSNKGFQGEISDLSPDLVQALREHYETTWNPFSPDLIPLHLWRKKEGIPNYRDAYAHLFACKRDRAREQGILFN